MKLVHPDFFFQIEFEETKVINLIIESPQIFENMLSELYHQLLGEDGQWVLSENSKPIDLKKGSEIIFNPFELDINNKRVLGKLYDQIKTNTINSDLYLKWNELYVSISKLTDELIEDFDYHLEYESEIEIKDFLKLLNLRFISEATDSLERIIDYMNLHRTLLGTKIFILVNVKSYYSQRKLQHLYEQAFYQKYHLLLLETTESSDKAKNEKWYIIDKEGCVISQES